MIVLTEDYKKFEKMSHQFASDYGLYRHLPYEVFDCSVEEEKGFLEAFRLHIERLYSHRIEGI